MSLSNFTKLSLARERPAGPGHSRALSRRQTQANFSLLHGSALLDLLLGPTAEVRFPVGPFAYLLGYRIHATVPIYHVQKDMQVLFLNKY